MILTLVLTLFLIKNLPEIKKSKIVFFVSDEVRNSIIDLLNHYLDYRKLVHVIAFQDSMKIVVIQKKGKAVRL